MDYGFVVERENKVEVYVLEMNPFSTKDPLYHEIEKILTDKGLTGFVIILYCIISKYVSPFSIQCRNSFLIYPDIVPSDLLAVVRVKFLIKSELAQVTHAFDDIVSPRNERQSLRYLITLLKK